VHFVVHMMQYLVDFSLQEVLEVLHIGTQSEALLEFTKVQGLFHIDLQVL